MDQKVILYVVQSYYDPLYEWEDVYTTLVQQEALDTLELYNKNEPEFVHRLKAIIKQE